MYFMLSMWKMKEKDTFALCKLCITLNYPIWLYKAVTYECIVHVQYMQLNVKEDPTYFCDNMSLCGITSRE